MITFSSRVSACIPCAFFIFFVCQTTLDAEAETLADALAAAYDTNPRIETARTRSQATNEGITKATAGFLPRVAASGSAGFQTDARAPSLSQNMSTRQAGFDITVTQPLFDGGHASGALDAAKSNSRADKETVTSVTQDVMLAAAIAYLDVLQDRRLMQLNEDNAVLLYKTANAARKRAVVHEATIADVAQAEAALANAGAQIELSKSNLANSESAFEEASGHRPGELTEPETFDDLLPVSREAALQIVQRENPAISAAVSREQAARAGIDQARALLLPSVSLQGAFQRRSEPSTVVGDNNGLVGKVVVNVPIYSGDAMQADVREATHLHSAARAQLADVRAQTRTGVAQAWSKMTAARAALVAIRTQVSANKTALVGVEQEQRMGQRSVQDIINAQLALLAAQTTQHQLTRDVFVASCTVLALVGRLDPQLLEHGRLTASMPRLADWSTTTTSGDGVR